MLTIVYYTGNSEDEAFEQKIRDNLVSVVGGKYPIVSVSQKPINLGENICVGDVGLSDANAFRQLQIGIEHAKTKFVAAAESDTLYPPGYFDILPPDEQCWRYTNVCILKKWIGGCRRFGGRGYRTKDFSECAQMAGRDYWLERVTLVLKDRPTWSPDRNFKMPLIFGRRGFNLRDKATCTLPVLNIKTANGLRKYTRTVTGEVSMDTIPHWGFCNDMRDKLFGVGNW